MAGKRLCGARPVCRSSQSGDALREPALRPALQAELQIPFGTAPAHQFGRLGKVQCGARNDRARSFRPTIWKWPTQEPSLAIVSLLRRKATILSTAGTPFPTHRALLFLFFLISQATFFPCFPADIVLLAASAGARWALVRTRWSFSRVWRTCSLIGPFGSSFRKASRSRNSAE